MFKTLINKENLQLAAIYTVASIVVLLASYEPAHANVFDQLGQAVLNILNNTFLRVVAIVAVIVVGIRAFRGRMEWESAIWVILGIVIVFGAAGIVDFIIENAGTV